MNGTEFLILATIGVVSIVAWLGYVQRNQYKRNRPKVLAWGDRILISQKIVKTGNRIGKFVAFRDVTACPEQDQVNLGFSVRSKVDKHNGVAEEEIAMESAYSCYDTPLRIPAHVLPEFVAFYERCIRYYKGCTLPTAVQVYDYPTKTYVDATVYVSEDAVDVRRNQ